MEEMIFYPLVSFPNDCNDGGWARLKSQEPRTSSKFPLWVSGAEILMLFIRMSGCHMLFPKARYQGADWEVDQEKLEPTLCGILAFKTVV